MRLRSDLYYFCRIKRDPNIIKIRRCCVRKECPYLGTRPRKNHNQKGADLHAEDNLLRVPRLRKDQIPQRVQVGEPSPFRILQESPG